MPTGQQIITRAVSVLNIIDDGGGISASESAGLLIELNAMNDAWATEETLVPSVSSAQYALTASLNPYSFGPIAAGFTGAVLLPAGTPIASATNATPVVFTRVAHGLISTQLVFLSGFTANWTPCNGAFPVTVLSANTFSITVDSTGFGAMTGTPVFQLTNVARPVRVDGAYQISTVGGGTNRNKLNIIGSKEYFEHNDLSASGTSSDEVYLDFNDAAGLMKAYFFPVPTCPTATFVEFQVWNAIAAWALGTNQTLPPGYEDAIVYALAYRCIPRYGAVVNAEVAQVVTSIGVTAKDRIRKLNVMNRLLDPASLPQSPQTAPAAQAGR